MDKLLDREKISQIQKDLSSESEKWRRVYTESANLLTSVTNLRDLANHAYTSVAAGNLVNAINFEDRAILAADAVENTMFRLMLELGIPRKHILEKDPPPVVVVVPEIENRVEPSA